MHARVETHLTLRRLRDKLALSLEQEREISSQLRRETEGRRYAEQRILEHMARMAGLAELSNLSSKHKTEIGLLKACARVARRITGTDWVELVLVDSSGQRYQVFSLDNEDNVDDSHSANPEEMPWVQHCLDSETIIIDDFDEANSSWAEYFASRIPNPSSHKARNSIIMAMRNH